MKSIPTAAAASRTKNTRRARGILLVLLFAVAGVGHGFVVPISLCLPEKTLSPLPQRLFPRPSSSCSSNFSSSSKTQRSLLTISKYFQRRKQQEQNSNFTTSKRRRSSLFQPNSRTVSPSVATKKPHHLRLLIQRKVATFLLLASLVFLPSPRPSYAAITPASSAASCRGSRQPIELLVASTSSTTADRPSLASEFLLDNIIGGDIYMDEDDPLLDYEDTSSAIIPPPASSSSEGTTTATIPPPTTVTPKHNNGNKQLPKSAITRNKDPSKQQQQPSKVGTTSHNKKQQRENQKKNHKAMKINNKKANRKKADATTSTGLAHKVKKAVTATATVLVGVGVGLVLYGGEEEDDDDDTSVFLEKKRRMPQGMGMLQDLPDGLSDDPNSIADNSRTPKQMPPKQPIQRTSLQRAQDATRILEDIRASREKRELAMEESHARVEAIQNELRSNDEVIAAKKQAAQDALQNLQQVRYVADGTVLQEQVLMEEQQQQRAAEIIKSEEKRRQRRDIQQQEDVRHNKNQKQAQGTEKTPQHIRADQRQERARRGLMETRYHSDLVDDLVEKRERRQRALDESSQQKVLEIKEKYNPSAAEEPTVVAVENVPLEPRPPSMPVPVKQLLEEPPIADVNVHAGDEEGTDVSNEQKRDFFARVTKANVSVPTLKPNKSTPLKTDQRPTGDEERKRELAARALLKARLVVMSQASVKSKKDQDATHEATLSVEAAEIVKKQELVVLSDAPFATETAAPPAKIQTSLEEQQKSEIARRGLMKRRLITKSQALPDTQSERANATNGETVIKKKKSFRERLLSAFERSDRLSNAAVEIPTASAPVTTTPSSSSTSSWSERSARNLLTARLTTKSARSVIADEKTESTPDSASLSSRHVEHHSLSSPGDIASYTERAARGLLDYRLARQSSK